MRAWSAAVLMGVLACGGEAPQGDAAPPPAPPPAVDLAACPVRTQPAAGLARAALQAHGEEEPVLVSLRPGLLQEGGAAGPLQRVGAVERHRFARFDTVAARLTAAQRAALAGDPDVLAIEPDPAVHARGVGEYTSSLVRVQAPWVWDANQDGAFDPGAVTGAGVRVCVIDSGWDDRHPELKAAYAGGCDFLDEDTEPLDRGPAAESWGTGHGTHVAGILAAQLGTGAGVGPGEDAGGIVGVAPGVSLLIARVLKLDGSGHVSDYVAALRWCQGQGARVINMSLGHDSAIALEAKAIAEASAAGAVIVSSAGNEADEDSSPLQHYPADYPEVIGVGALTSDNVRARFSQYGRYVSLVAPGVDVYSTLPVGSYTYAQVTSPELGELDSLAVEYTELGDVTAPLVDCGAAADASTCGAGLPPEGFVALVDRGGVDAGGTPLTFAVKATNVKAQGARALLFVDNVDAGAPGAFTFAAPGAWLPAASVSRYAGSALRSSHLGRPLRVHTPSVDYGPSSGTSMAAPHVAGVAALLLSARPTLTPAQVRALLEDSAADLGATGRDDFYGHGLVQALEALKLLHARHPAP